MAATPPRPRISFMVVQNPESNRIEINLAKVSKLSVVSLDSVVTWEVTNSLLDDITVQIVGLNSSIQTPLKAVAIKSGARKAFDAMVTEEVDVPARRGYSIWVKAGKAKAVSVDPDLQLDPPADGGGRATNLLGAADYTIPVTIDTGFLPEHPEVEFTAKVGQTIDWSVTNLTEETVTFTVNFPNAEVSFAKRYITVQPTGQNAPKTLRGKVEKATPSVDDVETVSLANANNSLSYAFTFAPASLKK